MKKNNFLLLLLIFFTLNLEAQVTIGHGSPPSRAALLQLKDKKADPTSITGDDNITSTTGGLVLPRVKLVEANTLKPFINFDEGSWTEDEKQKEKYLHTGLMVYNLNTTGNFKQGIYIWDGSKWDMAGSTVMAENGLVIADGNKIRLGGTLIDTTQIALGLNNLHFTTTGGRIGVGTTAPKATLDIEGNLRVGSASSVTGNATTLVRGEDGIIGTATAAPTRLAFVQSTEGQVVEAGSTQLASLNAGDPIVVQWNTNTDVVINNVVDFIPEENAFEIRMAGIYELSGYINFVANATLSSTYPSTIDNGRAGVNVSVQVFRDGAWVDFSAARSLFTGTAVQGTAQTIVVPPSVAQLDAGTKVRMIFKKPTYNFGLPLGTHSTLGSGIQQASGLQFTKGMKILALSIQ